MFNSARWRLTLWFAGVVLVILVALGLVVSFTAKKALLDAAQGDLRSRADRDAGPLAVRIIDALRRGASPSDITIAPTFTAGGYFYTLVDQQGNNVAATQNLDPAGLVPQGQLDRAITAGRPRFVRTSSSDGEDLMVYLVPFSAPRGNFVLEVGRSIEPELGAVHRLNFILIAGGAGGVLLALVGGYFLAGRTL
ncbi:MAG TPA: hypothetical protein VFB90_07690, partial [Dehalococcoidia bacterium]|nr:hypothetical protein [Dehalococcoidia bacterium]